jgi:hypothetical protein
MPDTGSHPQAPHTLACGCRLKEQRVREEGYAATNARRINAEWLQRMRAAKLDELRNEASALAREHDREVDRRDRLIEVHRLCCTALLCGAMPSCLVLYKAQRKPPRQAWCGPGQAKAGGELAGLRGIGALRILQHAHPAPSECSKTLLLPQRGSNSLLGTPGADGGAAGGGGPA